ncbi:MAG: hypothetical protein H6886_08365 [Hyphomicrobiaceae bacterium]|nr:hypothetical protein [Hyphomicrobiaceae bacterium]
MKRLFLAGMLAIASVAAATLSPQKATAGGGVSPYAAGDIEVDRFYDALAPFGDWVSDPRYGYVWYPRSVAEDWRPFTVGNWIYTDEHGWYWDSPEPFAWAVYHYGRWGYDPEYAWYWVPGDVWAPAWVQWRYSDDYVGWAPEAPVLPAGGYGYGRGYYGPRGYAGPSYGPAPDAWTFVRPRYLAEPAVRSYAVPLTSFSLVFSSTKYVYRPEYRHGGVYNAGMPRDHWSRVTHRRLDPYRVHRSSDWDNGGRNRHRDTNGRANRDLYVYAPHVKKNAAPRRAPRTIAQKPPHRKGTANQARANAPATQGALTPFERAAAVKPSYVQKKLLDEERRRPPAGRPHQGGKPKQDAAKAKPGGSKPARTKSATANQGQPKNAHPDQANRGPGRGPGDGDRGGRGNGARDGGARDGAHDGRYDRRSASRNPDGWDAQQSGRGSNARSELRNRPNGNPEARGDKAYKPDGNGRHGVNPENKKQSGAKMPANQTQAKKPQSNQSQSKRQSGPNPQANKPSSPKPQARKQNGPETQAKEQQPKKPQAKMSQAKQPQAKKPDAKNQRAMKPQTKPPQAKQAQSSRSQSGPGLRSKPNAAKNPAKAAQARPSGPSRDYRGHERRPQQQAGQGGSGKKSHAMNAQQNGGGAKKGSGATKGGNTKNRSQAKQGGDGGKCQAKPSVCRNRG